MPTKKLPAWSEEDDNGTDFQRPPAHPRVTRHAIEGIALLKNSLLYQEYWAESEEIKRHKWLESEKVGYDLGFEWALMDWILKHRSGWKRYRQSLRA